MLLSAKRSRKEAGFSGEGAKRVRNDGKKKKRNGPRGRALI